MFDKDPIVQSQLEKLSEWEKSAEDGSRWTWTEIQQATGVVLDWTPASPASDSQAAIDAARAATALRKSVANVGRTLVRRALKSAGRDWLPLRVIADGQGARKVGIELVSKSTVVVALDQSIARIRTSIHSACDREHRMSDRFLPQLSEGEEKRKFIAKTSQLNLIRMLVDEKKSAEEKKALKK